MSSINIYKHENCSSETLKSPEICINMYLRNNKFHSTLVSLLQIALPQLMPNAYENIYMQIKQMHSNFMLSKLIGGKKNKQLKKLKVFDYTTIYAIMTSY